MSSRTLELRVRRPARPVAACLGFAASMAMVAPLPTWAQAAPDPAEIAAARAVAGPTAPEDPLLDDALDEMTRGVPLRAEPALRELAERGNVFAMERLGLLFWYGDALYPGVPRDLDIAHAWFSRAARHGSALGRRLALAAALRRDGEQATERPGMCGPVADSTVARGGKGTDERGAAERPIVEWR